MLPRLPSLIVVTCLFVIAPPKSYADDSVEVTIHRDLVFANIDGNELKLDLYIPASNASTPLVVWIHGGGWRAGSKNTPKLKAITQHGFALASISYRFSDKGTFPAQIHDCKAAVRWLRANAERYDYNAEWMAVAGSSAGGHLALLMGTSGDVAELEGEVGGNLDHSSRVQAVVDYFGPSDFVLRGKTQPERAYTHKSGSLALLGGAPDKRPSKKTETFASPAHYVSADDPPILVFHGTADKTVLLDQSQHIVELFEKEKLEAKLVVLENAGHGGNTFFQNEHLETAVRFLKTSHANSTFKLKATDGAAKPKKH